MSNIFENQKKKKFPLELISKLLKELLGSKISKLETKNQVEMNNIESMSHNTKIIINELQTINKKVKSKIKTAKKITIYNNLDKRTNIKISTKLHSSITCKRRNAHTPDRKLFSKNKTKKNNNIKNIKLDRSSILTDDSLISKSNTTSKILTLSKRESRLSKKSNSKKKKRDMTPIPLTPSSMYRRKKKQKEKSKNDYNNTSNTSLIKHNNTSINFYNKYQNKSCKTLPLIKKRKDKLNMSKFSKKNELELICTPAQDDDKRIYDLNPDISKNILNKEKNNKVKSIIFKRKETEDFNKSIDNKELTLNDSLMNDVNNDELLIFYHNKKTTRLLDDITLNKSFLGDELDCELDVEINIENHHINNNKNNYTLAERLELCLDYLNQFLTKEEFLKIGLINKECFKMIMHTLISKREDIIDDAKEVITNLKNNYPDIIDKNDNNNNFTIQPFECNNNSIRAIPLLEDFSLENIFNYNKSIDINNKYIILVFDLFFIAIGYKKNIISFKNDIKSKWDFYKKFFEKNNNKSFESLIKNILKGKIFDYDTINTLYEFSKNYIDKIKPSFFQEINSDIGLFVFIVQDILEHVGITKDLNNKKKVGKVYLLYNIRLTLNSIILQKLNKINSIISSKK